MTRRRTDPDRIFGSFCSVRNEGNGKYRLQVENNKISRAKWLCKRNRIYIRRIYPENLGRSSTYRRDFFRENKRPIGGYRCRYCNRRLPDKKVTIDHVIPIYMASTGRANFPMRLMGITDINDPKNLVPACDRCNKRKGRNAGIWIYKAMLGKHRTYWIARKLLLIAVIAIAVYLLLFGLPEWINEYNKLPVIATVYASLSVR